MTFQSDIDEGLSKKLISQKNIASLQSVEPLKANIDFAFKSESGDLVVVGWIFDPQDRVEGLAVLLENTLSGFDESKFNYWPLEHGSKQVQISRVLRQDVTSAFAALGRAKDDLHGFVLVIPRFPVNGDLALALEGDEFVVLPVLLSDNESEIERMLKECCVLSGTELLNALQAAFAGEHHLIKLIHGIEEEKNKIIPQSRLVSLSSADRIKVNIDFAFNSERKDITIVGRIADPDNRFYGLSILVEQDGNLLEKIRIDRWPTRYGSHYNKAIEVIQQDNRATLCTFAGTDDSANSFILIIPKFPEGGKLAISMAGDKFALVPIALTQDALEIYQEIKRQWSVWGKALVQILQAVYGQEHRITKFVIAIEKEELLQVDISESFAKFIATEGCFTDNIDISKDWLAGLRNQYFRKRHQLLPQMVEDPQRMFCALDKAYILDRESLLIFGWWFSPQQKPRSVTVVNEDYQSAEILHEMHTLKRSDVIEAYSKRLGKIDEWCGFICLATIPVDIGKALALCFDFGKLGEVWLKIPVEIIQADHVTVLNDIIGRIPAHSQLSHKLFNLFSCCVGRAIEIIRKSDSIAERPIDQWQFGKAPTVAETSMIVPLYGRYDFVRHQLAHFAGDKDLSSVDLLYVVDDPAILTGVLDLASKYSNLFGIPFRVITCGKNQGFAGANNLGVRAALGDYLILMNSDVIPQYHGWISILKRNLDTLPDAGAVGPLLQFADNSIQHAGMYPRLDDLLPGFIFNTHPMMGMAWEGGDQPSEHPMLTAACLMLKKQDYLAVGGLDEGYIIGDFEDSDLCLALRNEGKRLWLVPGARLWHLERQSQGLGIVSSYRQLLTLFNSWRYTEKINKKLLPDPFTVKI